MKHTYLFEEGLWKARGVFVDEKGRKFTVEGQAVISQHEADQRTFVPESRGVTERACEDLIVGS
jgi:hypothetical protein